HARGIGAGNHQWLRMRAAGRAARCAGAGRRDRRAGGRSRAPGAHERGVPRAHRRGVFGRAPRAGFLAALRGAVRRAHPPGGLTVGALAGWIHARRGAPEAHAVVPMLESLAHRVNVDGQSGDALEACIDTERDREIVLAASFSDAASGISLSLDGALLNREALRKELHRYSFGGESDAELLARAYQRWDKDVVRHLHGAFAFALWDGPRRRLMLARDRFGEKPLYLREAQGALYFGSQLKA